MVFLGEFSSRKLSAFSIAIASPEISCKSKSWILSLFGRALIISTSLVAWCGRFSFTALSRSRAYPVKLARSVVGGMGGVIGDWSDWSAWSEMLVGSLVVSTQVLQPGSKHLWLLVHFFVGVSSRSGILSWFGGCGILNEQDTRNVEMLNQLRSN